MSFKRARTETQIQKRLEEIIAAACTIFDQGGHEAVTFTAISELTKFTRPTIYKYFATKEAILLTILARDIKTWAQDLKDHFKINQLYSTKEIAHIWSQVLARHPRANALHAIMYTILERNVSLEVMVAFKKELFENMMPVYDLLEALFPNCEPRILQQFLMQQYALAMGVYSMTHLTPLQQEAMLEIQPNYQSQDFASAYEAVLYPVMKTLED